MPPTWGAWDSYFTTLTISSIAAPLTAIVGLSTAYLLVRQNFIGKDAFEFTTMLSFAIPGTVIGVSYIMAFNFPPIELTGTSIILIIAFVFRNMPVGVRAKRRVRLGGEDVTHLTATYRKASMVFQSYALFPHMICACLKIRHKVLPPQSRAHVCDGTERLKRKYSLLAPKLNDDALKCTSHILPNFPFIHIQLSTHSCTPPDGMLAGA